MCDRNIEANSAGAALALSQFGCFFLFVGLRHDQHGVFHNRMLDGVHPHFVLGTQPMGIGISVGSTIVDPEMIGTFANSFFQVFHETSPFAPKPSKIASEWLTKS
jgi:hypothetical protein